MNAAPVERGDRRWWKRGRLLVAAFLLFWLGASVVTAEVKRFALNRYGILSSGMEPTLHCARPNVGCEANTADRVVVVRFLPFWTPRRGDVVAFETPPNAALKCGARGTFIKRVVGLPGETVTEKRGTIFVDGERLNEPYVKPARRDSRTRSRTWKVPAVTYFVMGDNRASSCDSRAFGAVPRGNLVGPVVASYWPFDRMGLL